LIFLQYYNLDIFHIIVIYCHQDQQQLKSKDKELQKLNDFLRKLEEKSKKDTDAVQAAQDHFHAVSAGLSSNDDGEEKTLADQIMSELFNIALVPCFIIVMIR
jgi:structural maintenance of chromosome 2